MNKAEYKRQWREKNKEKLRVYYREYKKQHQSDKKYYAKNKDVISDKKKQQYKTDQCLRQKLRTKSKARYITNKSVCLAKNRERAAKKRAKIAAVALHFGCQNPFCKWQGSFFSAQLQFHHLNRLEKEYSVSMMAGMSYQKIAREINKCCVLCACCHAAVTCGLITVDDIRCVVNDKLEWD